MRTAAIEVALQLAGIGPGDEVIAPAQSFFCVLDMIIKVGATPRGRRFGYHRGDLPNAEPVAASTVTLPPHSAMTEDDVDRVCAARASIVAKLRRR